MRTGKYLPVAAVGKFIVLFWAKKSYNARSKLIDILIF